MGDAHTRIVRGRYALSAAQYLPGVVAVTAELPDDARLAGEYHSAHAGCNPGPTHRLFELRAGDVRASDAVPCHRMVARQIAAWEAANPELVAEIRAHSEKCYVLQCVPA